MKDLLKLVSILGIAVGLISAVISLADKTPIGFTSSCTVVVLAGILWMLTAIHDQVARLVASKPATSMPEAPVTIGTKIAGVAVGVVIFVLVIAAAIVSHLN